MNLMSKNILDLVELHAQKARCSQYDRDVCILAISAARDAILMIPTNISSASFRVLAQDVLSELHGRYYDPDGEYTSGKSVIGALLDDIRSLMDE